MTLSSSDSIQIDRAVEAAMACGGERPAVLLFTIASVQEFVAAARRTQDLWFGSYVFSFVMSRAMEALAGALGAGGEGAFLLPLARMPMSQEAVSVDDRLVASVPNLFTAIVPADRARKLGGKATSAILETRDAIFRAVRESIERRVPDLRDAWGPTWDRQREAFLLANIFWVAVPFTGRDGYADASRDAGRLLAARKSLRQFAQVPEPGEKCTLCGVRSALASRGDANSQDVRSFWEELAAINRSEDRAIPGHDVKLLGRLRRGERLCAVCLTKRMALQLYFRDAIGVDYHMFPSTASIAAAPWISRVLERCAADETTRDAVTGFAEAATTFLSSWGHDFAALQVPAVAERATALKNMTKDEGQRKKTRALSELDGQWFYRDAWAPAALTSELTVQSDQSRSPEDEPLRTAAARMQGRWRDLDKVLNPSKDLRADPASERGRVLADAGDPPRLGQPTAYFAVVAVDGDKMGDLISGERPGHPLDAGLHARIALGLHNFALYLAREVVERSTAGRLVYAGGDDVLALMPVEGVFSALRHLRWFFRGGATGGATVGAPEGWRGESVGDGSGRVSGTLRGKETPLVVPGEMTDLSAAVVFAHHSHPLAHAVEEAHHVLKEVAKRRYGRSAVAFRLMRRSGETTTTGVKWERSGRDLLGLLEVIVNGIQMRRLSASLGHDLKREGPAIGFLDAKVQAKLLQYVLSRRRGDPGSTGPAGAGDGAAARGGEPSTPTGAVIALLREIQALGGHPTGPEASALRSQWPENTTDPWTHTADLITVASFVARPAGE